MAQVRRGIGCSVNLPDGTIIEKSALLITFVGPGGSSVELSPCPPWPHPSRRAAALLESPPEQQQPQQQQQPQAPVVVEPVPEPPPPPKPIVKRGYVWKLSKERTIIGGEKWQRRFLALQADSLAYSASAAEAGNPKNVIPIKDCECSIARVGEPRLSSAFESTVYVRGGPRATNGVMSKTSLCFIAILGAAGREMRTFYFAAESQDSELEEWRLAIENNIKCQFLASQAQSQSNNNMGMGGLSSVFAMMSPQMMGAIPPHAMAQMQRAQMMGGGLATNAIAAAMAMNQERSQQRAAMFAAMPKVSPVEKIANYMRMVGGDPSLVNLESVLDQLYGHTDI